MCFHFGILVGRGKVDINRILHRFFQFGNSKDIDGFTAAAGSYSVKRQKRF